MPPYQPLEERFWAKVEPEPMSGCVYRQERRPKAERGVLIEVTGRDTCSSSS